MDISRSEGVSSRVLQVQLRASVTHVTQCRCWSCCAGGCTDFHYKTVLLCFDFCVYVPNEAKCFSVVYSV